MGLLYGFSAALLLLYHTI